MHAWGRIRSAAELFSPMKFGYLPNQDTLNGYQMYLELVSYVATHLTLTLSSCRER